RRKSQGSDTRCNLHKLRWDRRKIGRLDQADRSKGPTGSVRRKLRRSASRQEAWNQTWIHCFPSWCTRGVPRDPGRITGKCGAARRCQNPVCANAMVCKVSKRVGIETTTYETIFEEVWIMAYVE